MDELRLEVTSFTDIAHWRWRLTDTHGAFKVDHQVALNQTDPAHDAFTDLYDYLRYHAAPDRLLEHEAEIVAWLGRWIGEQVLGPVGAAIVEHAPVTVRMYLPEEAAGLLYRPFELGYVNDEPLALQEVSFVFDVAEGSVGRRKIDIGNTLRMLAVFSLPTDASALGLRRERHALKRLITTIAQTQGKAIELRIVQYGVTRDTLRTVLEDGEGWDVMHFSGHGLPAGLLLEKPDSTQDRVSVLDLEGLLRPARSRLKLVMLSACESAAPTLQETLRWLKLYEPERAEVAQPENASAEPLPALARTLATSLDCAVLAMRYPVGDAFAIDLAAHLYRGLLEQRRTLPAALQLALTLNAEIIASKEVRGAPALEVARTGFNDYSPLLRLGRYGDVRTLLYTCQAIFEVKHDIEMLGKVFTAMADLEDKLGHQPQAIDFAKTALRYIYLSGSLQDCARNHYNLSNYLQRAGRDYKVALAHRLTAGVIFLQMGSEDLTSTLQNLARDFAVCAPDLPPLPADFAEMCRLVEAVEGVRFQELFERLPRRAATGDAALAAVLQGAQEIAQRMVQQNRTPAPDTQRKPGKQGPRRRKSGKKRASND